MHPILHLSLPVRDLEEALAFYVEVLGCTPGRRRGPWADVWFHGLQLTLQQRPQEVLAPGHAGCRHLGVTLDVDELDAVLRQLDALGVEWAEPPRVDDAGTPQEQRKAKLRDPSGHVVELKAYPDVDVALAPPCPVPSTPAASTPGRASTWQDEAKVEEYLDRVGRLPARLAGEAALTEALPPTPARLLDLGTGDGRLVDVVLRARPSIEEVVALDRSPPMLERAAARFAADPRVRVVERDLQAPLHPLGSFDVVVSGFAIHHLEHDAKRRLFAEVATVLRPGGAFADLDVVESATPELHATFLAAIGRPDGDPEDRLAPVDDLLRWMRAAPLAQVDCLWRWRGFALLVGGAA